MHTKIANIRRELDFRSVPVTYDPFHGTTLTLLFMSLKISYTNGPHSLSLKTVCLILFQPPS